VAIDAQCPHCRKLLRAPDKKAGQQVNCPHCQQPIIVPDKLATASLERTAAVSELQSDGRNQAERAIVEVSDIPSISAASSRKTNSATGGGVSRSLDTTKSNGLLRSKSSTHSAEAGSTLPRATPVARFVDATWYMRTPDEEQYGPVKRQDLDQWVGEGRVDSECQILCDGWEQWKWASDVYPQLLAAAAQQDELPTIVADPTSSSFPQFENGPLPSIATEIGSELTSGGELTRSAVATPPPLPSSTSIAAPGETRILSATDARTTTVERGWIVTDVGLAMANVALWVALFGMVILFALHWLSHTASSRASIAVIGSLYVWVSYLEGAALIALVTSWCVCHSTPREAGARGWPQAAAGVVVLGLIVGLLVSLIARVWDTEAARVMARHLPAVLLSFGMTAIAFFALFLGKLGNFFGDARLSQQGTFCAAFQAVILAWSLVAMYALGSRADATANIMRSAVTAALFGGNAVWLGILTRRARLPLKSM
jgi:hypothetical protein